MSPKTYSTDRDFASFRIAEGRTNPKLLDVYRDALRVKHYSGRTEDTYVTWVRNFILFHNKRHPKDMGEQEIRAFIAHLAVDRKVATSTSNQALSAILFLYRTVLQKEIQLPPVF